MYEIKIKNLEMSIKNKKALTDLIQNNIDNTIIPIMVEKLIEFNIYSVEVYLYIDNSINVIINPIYIMDIVQNKSYLYKAIESISQLLSIQTDEIEVVTEKDLDSPNLIGHLEITSNKTIISIK